MVLLLNYDVASCTMQYSYQKLKRQTRAETSEILKSFELLDQVIVVCMYF